jgi:endonuclease YncB( thermonuclease family)
MVDGDTISVAGVGMVRLIGVDTPETVDPRSPVEFFGMQASEFTRHLADGNIVRLEFHTQRMDKYQRTLAYAYCRTHLPERRNREAGLRPRLREVPVQVSRSIPRLSRTSDA